MRPCCSSGLPRALRVSPWPGSPRWPTTADSAWRIRGATTPVRGCSRISGAIQRAAIADTPLLLREVLEAVGISIHDIDHVITHQTSARAIRKGMARMSVSFGDRPKHDAVITVDRYGNTASTTHTVALVEELEAGRIEPGERVALLALASGLEIGVVLLTVDEELVGRYGHGH